VVSQRFRLGFHELPGRSAAIITTVSHAWFPRWAGVRMTEPPRDPFHTSLGEPGLSDTAAAIREGRPGLWTDGS
jgi:hypothetical protein